MSYFRPALIVSAFVACSLMIGHSALTLVLGSGSEKMLIRTAPNGDLFVAESKPGRIKVFRGISEDGKAERVEIFASGLKQPFGIAFYPLGANPKYVFLRIPTPSFASHTKTET